jgi:hypothetical protein
MNDLLARHLRHTNKSRKPGREFYAILVALRFQRAIRKAFGWHQSIFVVCATSDVLTIIHAGDFFCPPFGEVDQKFEKAESTLSPRAKEI